MFLDVDNSLNTRQSPTGAVVIKDTVSAIDILGTDLRRGPGKVATCSLYVGTAGRLNVTTADGDTVNIVTNVDGTFLPLQVIRVNSIFGGTDNIIGLY